MSRVADALEKTEQGSDPVSLTPDDRRELILWSGYDPNAALFLALAYYKEIIDPPEGVQQLVLATGREFVRECRARAALPLLEFACRAGKRGAFEALKESHSDFFRIYKAQLVQSELD